MLRICRSVAKNATQFEFVLSINAEFDHSSLNQGQLFTPELATIALT